MKKLNYLLISITIILMFSCKKSDQNAPVITLKGTNPYVVVWGSTSAFIDPGAVAIDDIDGAIDYSVYDTLVDMRSAGVYHLIYSATDAAGNKDTVSRNVVVSGSRYLMGNFTVQDFRLGTFNTAYQDTLSDSNYNILKFKHFAIYEDAKVYAKISGTQINIPPQHDTIGTRIRTFSGYGSFANDSVFTITYSVTDSTTTFEGYDEYHRN
jgi:hypothetical protein